MVATPRRILVAEDDDDSRTLIKRYLEGKGYAVLAVANGGDALAALTREVVDLAVLDHMMPGKTGLEVLAAARGAGNAVPVIMATAVASPDQIVHALDLGADDYVTKPFSPSVLAARIALRLRLRAIAVPPASADVDTVTSELPPVELETPAPRPPDDAGPQVGPLIASTRIAGRYAIAGVINEGGFGTVYRARHLDLEADVAIKVVRGRLQRTAVAQFRREAQLACRVRHPNAVRVLDFGVLPDGAPFLVMDLLEGPTLEGVLQRTPSLPVERAITVLQAVLSALAATHRVELVHCDVKPSNIILRLIDGRELPTLCDFGIATEVKDAKDSASKGIAGSAAYLAPERITKQRYDGRVDVYACGMMLYRALTGGFPFDPADLEGVMEWHLRGERRPASEWRPELTRAVDLAVARLLAVDPTERPTAEEAETLMASLVWEA